MQLIGGGERDHPNVLGCIEALVAENNLYVVMPFCDSGDLLELLQDETSTANGRLSEAQARYWFRQIMEGVKHLHYSVGICHRNLSFENVMLNGTTARIINMRLSLRLPYCRDSSSDSIVVTDALHGGTIRCLFKPQGPCGKLSYMSPEVYRNQSFDGEAVDVWSAGVILFCMVTGNRSYQRPHLTDPQFTWMTRGLSQLLADWKVELSPECLHLLQNVLQVDPRLRLTIDEVLNHAWFLEPNQNP
jgi:serine/threonine protein kinase